MTETNAKSGNRIKHEAPNIDYSDYDEVHESEAVDDREAVIQKIQDACVGDMLQINNRARPLEVISFDEAYPDRLAMAFQETVFLKGNGTKYRIKIYDSGYPKMDRGQFTPNEYVAFVNDGGLA